MDNLCASDSLIDGQVMYRKGDLVQLGGVDYIAKHDITVGEVKRINISTNPVDALNHLSPIKH